MRSLYKLLTRNGGIKQDRNLSSFSFFHWNSKSRNFNLLGALDIRKLGWAVIILLSNTLPDLYLMCFSSIRTKLHIIVWCTDRVSNLHAICEHVMFFYILQYMQKFVPWNWFDQKLKNTFEPWLDEFYCTIIHFTTAPKRICITSRLLLLWHPISYFCHNKHFWLMPILLELFQYKLTPDMFK